MPTHIHRLMFRDLQEEEEESPQAVLEEVLFYQELLFPEVFNQEICNLEVNQEFL